MSARSRLRAFTPILAGAALAMGASVALAQGKGGDGDPPTLTEQACEAIGCPGGNRQCGVVQYEVRVWLWTPWFPVPWSFKEVGHCYETSAF